LNPLPSAKQLNALRTVITENIRVQRGGAEPVGYVDIANALAKASSRQNHVIFGRRGCGKSLLLHESTKKLDAKTKAIYLNCEDFKNHSFPNVLIEILDSIFQELEKHVNGWFGRKRRCREVVTSIRKQLARLKESADEQSTKVKESTSSEASDSVQAGASVLDKEINLTLTDKRSAKAAIELEYQRVDSKIHQLNLLLTDIKKQIREIFELSTSVSAVFIQLDDFYHLQRTVQPHVIDYIHRLCKDLPLYFKIATLRHASVLFAERQGQPTGAQERHDYQPINVDFTLQDVGKTEKQLKQIFHAFAERAVISVDKFDHLFKGEGFRRLVLAGGGVPRDCLSLFVEQLDDSGETIQRIGKDEIRAMSLTNFERRIEELKTDSEQSEQDSLLRGIYVLRVFCLSKKNNIFMVSEQTLREHDTLKELINRLLDYRIIHSVGSAYTHKSKTGSFQAFMIDIGSYAFLRKLHGKLTEVDLFETGAKEKIRAAPIVEEKELEQIWKQAPANVEQHLLDEGEGEAG
jgi:flagellar biosynthesis GTPase FlhF